MKCLIVLLALSAAVARASEPGKIECSQESLKNGLHVVYFPRRDWPVVSVRVVYHVGSREEREDRQGFAHLFEHMMFRGSAHVRGQEHLSLIDRVGGVCNADTTADQTSYYETLPANQLELALWLEADRMASLEVTESALVAERKVVAQEWAAKRSSTWRWLLDDYLPAAFAGSTYRWPPIGNMQQLQQARVEELREFFAKWYAPANATLIVSGDFDVAKTQASVRRLFGWIGAQTSAPATRPAVCDAPAGVVEIKRASSSPVLMLGVRTRAYGDASYAQLRVLAGVLRQRLNRYLVRTPQPLANAVDVALLRMEGAGAIVVIAVLPQGANFDRVSQAITAQVKVIYNEATQRELDESASDAAIETLARRETASGMAGEIGDALLRGDGKLLSDDELSEMTRIGIMDLGEFGVSSIDGRKAIAVRVIPDTNAEQPGAIASQAERTQNAPVAASTRPSTHRVTVFPDDFPTTPPAATQPIEREAEQAVREVEGAKVIVLPDHGTSLVHWAVLLRHPASTPAGKEGVAELTASLLGAQVHRDVFDPRPRKRELLLAGVQLAAMARENFTLIRSSAEREKMTEGLEATRRLLREPDFLQGDFREEPFAGAKQKLISEIELSDAEPAKMASRELIAAVKGISPRLPTTRSVAGLTLGDVRGFYQQAYGPAGATLIIAGNVTAESGEEIAHQLLDGWPAQSASPRFARQPIHAATTATTTAPDRRMPIIVVDRPGAVQCTVRLAAPAYDAESTERFAGTLAGEILGEGVQSRLGKFVRTEHGYAYTVTARFLPMHDEGYFVASCDTEPATLAGTMTTVLEQIARMRDEFVSDAELADAKASLARRSLVREEGASQRLESRLARELTMTAGEKGDDEMRGSGYDSRVQGVSASEVRAVMQKYVQPGRMSVVVVGPASAVAETLRPFGEVRVVR